MKCTILILVVFIAIRSTSATNVERDGNNLRVTGDASSTRNLSPGIAAQTVTDVVEIIENDRTITLTQATTFVTWIDEVWTGPNTLTAQERQQHRTQLGARVTAVGAGAQLRRDFGSCLSNFGSFRLAIKDRQLLQKRTRQVNQYPRVGNDLWNLWNPCVKWHDSCGGNTRTLRPCRECVKFCIEAAKETGCTRNRAPRALKSASGCLTRYKKYVPICIARKNCRSV